MRPRRHLYLAISILGLLPLMSNAQEVMSLNPLFTEKYRVLEPAIEGTWCDESDNTVVFFRVGDNFYHMIFAFAGTPIRYEAALIRVADRLILDIFPRILDEENAFNRNHVARLHTFYYIDVSNQGNTLRARPASYGYFHEMAVRNDPEFEFAWSPEGILLTGSAQDIGELFVNRCNDEVFWEDGLIFRRCESSYETPFSDESADSTTLANNGVENLAHYNNSVAFPGCEPDFPYSNGWLGGDATLSIPISRTQDLWIFSDTWVGMENQRVREGARMVGNTIAISTCDEERGWHIEYFWRDMYTENPKPFFESHTHRYKYWPREAFEFQGDLYVALSKVGAKPGAPPDDIFSFSHIGSSLAKIPNFRTALPDEWIIDLIPWSSFIESDNWSFLAKHEDHLYIFYRIATAGTFLVRVPLAELTNPREHMEYLATDMTWRYGFDPDRARVVMRKRISGGGSLNYHADLHQWVAIYGPRFLDDKIFILTAPDIVGPWSEELAIYSTPELTPGNAGFDESYFCYAAREHMQFYDEETKRLLVTYDCNSSEMNTLLLNMTIYQPRVVLIPVVDSGLPSGD